MRPVPWGEPGLRRQAEYHLTDGNSWGKPSWVGGVCCGARTWVRLRWRIAGCSTSRSTEARLAHAMPCAPGCGRSARRCASQVATPFLRQQVRQARLVAKQRSAAHSQVQRARLALLLYRQPSLPSPEAGRRLGQSTGWAYHWRRVWATERFRLDDLPRSGRPRVYLATDQAVVIAIACGVRYAYSRRPSTPTWRTFWSQYSSL